VRGAAPLPPTPAALRERVAAALRDVGGDGDAPTPVACLAAGERLLAGVTAGDERSRGTALDLLAADALVTWAFELAAAAGDELEELAAGAMRRIARHAAAPAEPA
jgi:hypothetical protein